MLPTEELRAVWGPPCQFRKATITLHSGARLTVDARAVEAFQAIDWVMESFGYAPRAKETGAYHCRKVSDEEGLYSMHSYGIAADYNWGTNPYGAELQTDMPAGMVTAIKGIRTASGERVFKWGGDYSGKKDPTHFEVGIAPDDLVAGVNVVDVAPGDAAGVALASPATKIEAYRDAPLEQAESAYGPPPRRRIKIFAFDPMLGRRRQHRITIEVPYEELRPGPHGELISVVDHDTKTGRTYRPVDLDDRTLALNDGLDPLVDDPRFHQQMVYGVCMKVVENVERALGRLLHFDRPLIVLPHAFEGENAFFERKTHSLSFGYFHADPDSPGQNMPGELVFTCLSQDVVAHEMTHAIVNMLRPHYNEPSNKDVFAFHEAIADIVAIFQHFTFPGVLRRAIQDSRGQLGRSGPLVQLAQQFGQATGSGAALRAVGEEGRPPDRSLYEKLHEPHDLGSILVSAVFEAFFDTYEGRIADLLRIATGGSGMLGEGFLHPDLVNRIADEAADTAQMVLTACLRAFEYLPPVDVTFGDFLRAIVTADREANPDDPFGLRANIAEAFLAHGIYPRDTVSLSPESLVWPVATRADSEHRLARLDPDLVHRLLELDAAAWGAERSADGAEEAQAEYEPYSAKLEVIQKDDQLRRYAEENYHLLRLHPDLPIDVEGLHSILHIDANGQPRREIVCQFTQVDGAADAKRRGGMPERGGTTVIFASDGRPRYVIPKPLPHDELDPLTRHAAEARLAATHAFVAACDRRDPMLAWAGADYAAHRMARRFNFAMVHHAIPPRDASP